MNNKKLTELVNISGGSGIIGFGTTALKNFLSLTGMVLNIVNYIISSLISVLYGDFSKVNSNFESRNKSLVDSIDSNIQKAGVTDEVKVFTFLQSPNLYIIDKVATAENIKKIPGVEAIGGIANFAAKAILKNGKFAGDKNKKGFVTFYPYRSAEEQKKLGKLDEEGKNNLNVWLSSQAVNDPEMLKLLNIVMTKPQSKISKKFNSLMNVGNYSEIGQLLTDLKSKAKTDESKFSIKNVLLENNSNELKGKKFVEFIEGLLSEVIKINDISEDKTIKEINDFKELQKEIKEKLIEEIVFYKYIECINGVNITLLSNVKSFISNKEHRFEVKNIDNLDNFFKNLKGSSSFSNQTKKSISSISKIKESFDKINSISDNKEKVKVIISLLDNIVEYESIFNDVKKPASTKNKDTYKKLILSSPELTKLNKESKSLLTVIEGYNSFKGIKKANNILKKEISSKIEKTEENYYNDKDIINEVYLCSIEKFMFENKLERKI
jgi:hypothetical protein